MTRTMGLLISLGLFSSPALAQGKPDPLEACYQQPDGAPRLACFNLEMQRRRAAGSTTVPAGGATTNAHQSSTAAAPATPGGDAKVAAVTVGLQGSARRKKLKDDGLSSEPAKPIIAKVVRMVPRPHSVLAFVLDNGQTWEQVETLDGLNVKLEDTVTIRWPRHSWAPGCSPTMSAAVPSWSWRSFRQCSPSRCSPSA